MKSKTELFKRLSIRFDKGLPHIGSHSISDETYGKQSFIYFFNIQSVWGVTRRHFEDILIGWGYRINRRYWVENDDCAEVRVSYFKGWHWDE